MTTAVVSQPHYRIRLDHDGVNATPTWAAAVDTAPSVQVNTPFCVRMTIQETAGGTTNVNSAYKLQASLNSTVTYQDVTTTSSIVRATAAASSSADEASLTVKQLTGTGTFANGRYDNTGAESTAIQLTANQNSEIECGVLIVGADVADGDTIRFKLVATAGTAVGATGLVPGVVTASKVAVETKFWDSPDPAPRRAIAALTVAVISTTFATFTPQSPTASPAAPSSGAFVSTWEGPQLTRSFQYQSVSQPYAPVTTAVVVPEQGFQGAFSTPRFVVSRVHLNEGITKPGLPIVAGTSTPTAYSLDQFGIPRFRASRVHLNEGIALDPQVIAADPTPSSGAFVSGWAGPQLSRQFQYQSVSAPLLPPTVATFGFDQTFAQPRFTPGRTQLLEGITKPAGLPVADPAASTPFGWNPSFGPVPRSADVMVDADSVFIVPGPDPNIAWLVEFSRRFPQPSRVYLNAASTFAPQTVSASPAAPSSGAFVSTWDSPARSVAFQYQSVSQTLYPIVAAQVAQPLGWYVGFDKPQTVKRRTDGWTTFVAPLESRGLGWFVQFDKPAVVKSAAYLRDGFAYTPGQTAGGTVNTTTEFWRQQFSEPVRPKSRAHLDAASLYAPQVITAAQVAQPLGWLAGFDAAQKAKQRSVGEITFVAPQSSQSLGWFGPFDKRSDVKIRTHLLDSVFYTPGQTAGGFTPTTTPTAWFYGEFVRPIAHINRPNLTAVRQPAVIWDPQDPANLTGTTTPPVVVGNDPGGRIVGGHFSRKKWHDIKEAREARAELERRAAEIERKRDREKVERAAAKAEIAIEAAQQSELELQHEIARITRAMEAASSAKRVADAVGRSRHLVALTEGLMRKMAADAAEREDEEETIMLLLS